MDLIEFLYKKQQKKVEGTVNGLKVTSYSFFLKFLLLTDNGII